MVPSLVGILKVMVSADIILPRNAYDNAQTSIIVLASFNTYGYYHLAKELDHILVHFHVTFPPFLMVRAGEKLENVSVRRPVSWYPQAESWKPATGDIDGPQASPWPPSLGSTGISIDSCTQIINTLAEGSMALCSEAHQSPVLRRGPLTSYPNHRYQRPGVLGE